MEIDIVKKGILIKDANGIIREARSNVILIQDNKKIVVDTGAYDDTDRIAEGFRKLNVRPLDIDIVINTHLHLDHCANNDLFSNATFITHEKELKYGYRPGIEFQPIAGETKITPQITIIDTPGHTYGSISVIVEDKKTYVIAGDAIPLRDNYENWLPPSTRVDTELAMKSMERITEVADIIIPGHDDLFANWRKEGAEETDI